MTTTTANANNFDSQVRVAVYRHIVDSGVVPKAAQVAVAVGCAPPDVLAAFQRLAAAHSLVLQADGELLMANPFSAVPTAFEVVVNNRRWWGNCIWDALGCVAALGGEGSVLTSCGCCGFALAAEVSGGRVRGEGIVHFALPARRWWDDIVFN